MDLFAAVDLRAGRAVRLVEGDFGRETAYTDDPVGVARRFAEGGAPWIHVVDLDAARTGEPTNRAVIEAIVAAVTVPVQVGGGVRRVEDAAALFAVGVTRVVVGTAAVSDPEVVGAIAGRWPGRVAVGLDHRDGEVQVRGWTEGGGRRVAELIPEVLDAGASAVIVTDIRRDGRLAGPDVVGLAGLLETTGAPLVASGGIAGSDDLRLLASVRSGGQGLAGAIVGRALYEGQLTVEEAVAACGAMDPGGPA
ncbi:1-(5-phosphoribosyl)-5-[(5-phosphoribosylamino)methylideneamino]imidazole-4-carboxamide isomerase [Acidimicrobiaceae bacterium USS-CC1]|uniref:1-(5-phosphoribosyl)-5-[(5-phosphoribosylamino)methylideneamino] imidazole-4-carboxamide isomerase n=1 Tax=Acidiferrimicrobium australe TaxID=2664430 RepID=A0ABW9QWJ6_9ACTN|nr:1-(5-phosphoribosyl)-5-[(5-phosphoribosylamino)methylideneamino]imidazole-4-carboxamide isomerase [Acidiferrimicrobium australe]